MGRTTTKVRGLCVATKFTTTDELVDKLHRYCDDTTIFIATRGSRVVGTASPLAILLEDKTPALRGWCVVVDSWTHGDNPYERPGVLLQLSRLTPDSRRVFAQLRAARAAAEFGSEPATSSEDTAVGGQPVDRRPRTEGYPLVKDQPPPTLQVPTVIAATRRRDTMRIRDALTCELPLFTNVRSPSATDELDPPTDQMADGEVAIIRSAPIAEGSEPKSNPRHPTAMPRIVPRDQAPRLIVAEGSRETRAPHSSYILPANPLSELTDESLRGFIDCRLYEDAAAAQLEALELAGGHAPRPVAPPRLPTDEAPPLPPPPVTLPSEPPPPPAGPAEPAAWPLATIPPDDQAAGAPLPALPGRPHVRWDIVVATATIALALVFAIAVLVKSKAGLHHAEAAAEIATPEP